mgnify:CR=1 FL=1
MSLVACRQDTDDVPSLPSRTLQMGACLTRAADGSALEDGTRLTFFLTEVTTAEQRLFTYNVANLGWKSDATVEEGTTYHVFGYMPAQSVTSAAITPLNGNFAYGAVLTLNGLPTMTTTDVCFVVAVKSGSGVSLVSDFEEWSYLYTGQEDDENSINMMFDHLYANLNLLFKAHSQSNPMRSIKLKKVVLSTTYAGQLNASITQPEGTQPVTAFTPTEEGSTVCTLLDDSDGITLNTVTPVSASIFVAPGTTGLTLTCTYDVYNEAGHIIRRNCSTVNALSEEKTSLGQGYKTDLSLTVNPTYLYVLSDEDAPELELTIE